MRVDQVETKQSFYKNNIYKLLDLHYENTPIQIYWKFHHQKLKIFL